MIAEKDTIETKPVAEAPIPVEERLALAVSKPQPKWNDKLFIASDICLLAGLLLVVIAMLLPVRILTTIVITFPMNLTLSLILLIIEVSLFVVGAILFVLGFIWPRIK